MILSFFGYPCFGFRRFHNLPPLHAAFVQIRVPEMCREKSLSLRSMKGFFGRPN